MVLTGQSQAVCVILPLVLLLVINFLIIVYTQLTGLRVGSGTGITTGSGPPLLEMPTMLPYLTLPPLQDPLLPAVHGEFSSQEQYPFL